jgi:hypothetical protein
MKVQARVHTFVNDALGLFCISKRLAFEDVHSLHLHNRIHREGRNRFAYSTDLCGDLAGISTI